MRSPAAPKTPHRRPTALCAHCGEPFELTPGRRGPKPRYCSPAHKQRAYEHRRSNAVSAEHHHDRAELTRLRGRLARLERENTELRQDLAAALDRIGRLLPDPYALRTGHDATRRTPPAPPPRRRGWRR